MARHDRTLRASLTVLGALACAGCPPGAPPSSPVPVATSPPAGAGAGGPAPAAGGGQGSAPAAAAAPALPHAWPPVKGEAFPDLAFLDDAGATVRLSSLRGKVLLVEPIGMSCPGCQGFSGGGTRGGFGGIAPQPGLPSIDEVLAGAGVDPHHPDLALVQVLFYDLHMGTPGPRDARAWAEHFGLAGRPNAWVLAADERYRAHPATYAMVPGFFLVDREGTLLLDATGHRPRDDLYRTLAPEVARLLGTSRGADPSPAAEGAGPEAPAAESATAPAPPRPAKAKLGVPSQVDFPEFAYRPLREACWDALEAADYDALEAALARAATLGRDARAPEHSMLLAVVGGMNQLGERPEHQRDRRDAWVRARPRSPLALAVRGNFYIRWAWQARGTGWADTVTEEGGRQFQQRLELARRDLEAALRLGDRSGLAAASLVTVAKGAGLPRSYAEQALAGARGTSEEHAALEGMFSYLQPRWYGSRDGADMWAFAEAEARSHPDDPLFLRYLLMAHRDKAHYPNRSTAAAYEKRLAAELDALHARIVARYPGRAESWAERKRLAKLCGDEAKEREFGLRAAEAGDPASARVYGWAMFEGKRGQPRDPERGLRLLAEAAHDGDAWAQMYLAQRLEQGTEVEQDLAWAARWYDESRGKEPTSAERLAALLQAGLGVERRDLEGAAALLRGLLESQHEDAKRLRRLATRRLTELERRAGPRGRPHPDGFDDWYPEDIRPPESMEYPCALSPLPRELPGVPVGDRAYLNHVIACVLEATRTKLALFRDVRWDEYPGTWLRGWLADHRELRARIAAERPPSGLEGFHADLLAGLDRQAEFLDAWGEALLAERPKLDALEQQESIRRWSAVGGRVFRTHPAGKESSTRLRAAWAQLEGRYGRAWTPAVKDSLFHHLCALDLF